MTGTDATWVTQFLGEELTAEENRLETAACEIIPCGLEKTVSYGSGTAAGPAAIISASHQLERLIGEDEACRHGLYTHPALDCSIPIAEVLHNVQKLVFACVRRGHVPVTGKTAGHPAWLSGQLHGKALHRSWRQRISSALLALV